MWTRLREKNFTGAQSSVSPPSSVTFPSRSPIRSSQRSEKSPCVSQRGREKVAILKYAQGILFFLTRLAPRETMLPESGLLEFYNLVEKK